MIYLLIFLSFFSFAQTPDAPTLVCAEAQGDFKDCENIVGTRSMRFYAEIQERVVCTNKKVTKNLLYFIDNTDFKGFCESIRPDVKPRRQAFNECRGKMVEFFFETARRAKAGVSCE